MNRPFVRVGTLAMLLAACNPAEDVEVQQLPSLARLSQEARAGVPEVSGVWRFVGWELAPDDTASLAAKLPGLGAIWLETQKRDSIAGQYLLPNWRVPLYGEVRRDQTVALVGVFAPGDLRFFAGRLERDTVWLELSSAVEAGTWPAEARAAFTRTRTPTPPFTRVRGAAPPVARVDTAARAPGDSLARAGAVVATQPPAQGPATMPQAPRPAPPSATPQTGRPAAPRATTTPPTTPRPRPTPPPAPRPAPDDDPEPDRVPLLGDPLAPDTTRG